MIFSFYYQKLWDTVDIKIILSIMWCQKHQKSFRNIKMETFPQKKILCQIIARVTFGISGAIYISYYVDYFFITYTCIFLFFVRGLFLYKEIMINISFGSKKISSSVPVHRRNKWFMRGKYFLKHPSIEIMLILLFFTLKCKNITEVTFTFLLLKLLKAI